MAAREALLVAIAITCLTGAVIAGARGGTALPATSAGPLQAPSLKNSGQQSDNDSSAQTTDKDSAQNPSTPPSLKTSGQQPDDDSTAQPSNTIPAHPSNDSDTASSDTSGSSANTVAASSDDSAGSANGSANDSSGADQGPPVRDVIHRTGRLSQQSKIEIVRYIDGEFAKTLVPLPSGKNALTIKPGEAAQAGQISGIRRVDSIATNKGEPVQITNIDFREKQIAVQINGGGKRKFHLLDHLQIGASEDPATVGDPNSHRGEGGGSMIVIDYGRPVPEMTPQELKHDLSTVLQFQTEHSATVNWVETLPKPFKDGIEDHRAVVGMNEDMVIAALGRPEHKVREKDDEGNDTEDWIYGDPPAKTTFVTFQDGKVVRVKEFS